MSLKIRIYFEVSYPLKLRYFSGTKRRSEDMFRNTFQDLLTFTFCSAFRNLEYFSTSKNFEYKIFVLKKNIEYFSPFRNLRLSCDFLCSNTNKKLTGIPWHSLAFPGLIHSCAVCLEVVCLFVCHPDRYAC